jgi:HemY protein
MLRALFYFAVLAVVVWGAVLLAERPGSVALEWDGWRVDTSFAVLLFAVAAVAAAVALLYRLWLFLRRAPGRLKWAWQTKRRQRGYQALTRGMVAIAAGDADEARRQARRADALLNEPPLTMLVSAQAAQMHGDEKAAAKFFTAMTEKPETEFLGLRGLMTQAMKRGDNADALRLARRAYRVQPKSAWIAGRLFDLEARAGQWLDARVTCDDLVRHDLIDAAQARRRKAVLNYQLGMEVKRRGALDDAVDRLKDARKLAPDFVPAVVHLADMWSADGRYRKAAGIIEDAWSAAPHPDLVEPYWRACRATDALARAQATKKLTGRNPSHAESHVALARASLAAQLWGEARRHLDDAVAGKPAGAHVPARLCRMMAELADRESGDAATARQWLMRAGLAGPDPMWVCGHCGNAVVQWSALCGKCGEFDAFVWRQPPSVVALADGTSGADVQAALPPAAQAADAGPIEGRG